jgi:hypothetical protein
VAAPVFRTMLRPSWGCRELRLKIPHDEEAIPNRTSDEITLDEVERIAI